MTDPHGRAGEYLEGLLDDESAAGFLAHVVSCEACQGELHGEVQLRDREDRLRVAADGGPGVEGGTVRSLDEARARSKRHRWMLGAVVLAAAAALVLVVWPRGGGRGGVRAPTLALAPTRSIEPRLSWAGAAAYRAYDTSRGSGAGESIDPRAIASLVERDDCAGVAAAYVLTGELARAHQQYERCGDGADRDADRAGLAILEGEPEHALELADRALAGAPEHAVATWNRALALRDLGFGLGAAAAFDRAAELDPAWAGEARQRAAAARDPLREAQRASEDVERIGREMATGGPVLPLALARRVPARARIYWHDALRLAATSERVEELRPLAAALEGLAGTDLARFVDVARERPSAATRDGYRRIFERPGAVDDAAWWTWLATARRDQAHDLILGARILTNRLGDGEPDSAAALAAATGDDWFRFAVDLGTARRTRNAGDLAGAAGLLAPLHDRCKAGAPAYRCAQLGVEAAVVAASRYQLGPAAAYAADTRRLAASIGEWPQRRQAVFLTGDVARQRGRTSLARAAYDDAARAAEGCDARHGFFALAEIDYQDHRFADARRALAEAPACDRPLAPNHVNTLARLLRVGGGPMDRDELRVRLAAARAARDDRTEQRMLDYIDAWIDLGEPGARERLATLAAQVATSSEVPDREVVAAVNSSLVVEAAERGAWDEAISVAAAALGVEVPRSCAVVVAVDEYRLAAVALDPAGLAVGHVERDRVEYRPAGWRAPDALDTAVRACAEVKVLALPPWIGIGPVFAPAVAWAYVLGPPPPSPSDPTTRRLVVNATEPPRELGLPPLAPPIDAPGATVVSGAAATPERVLAEARTATVIELHTHALWVDGQDAPVLALSPGASDWHLGADALRPGTLVAAPIVLLASCGSGAAAPFQHEAWGLPMAFRRAGARVVIAPLAPVPDREAAVFFEELGRALAEGATPAVAVSRLRAAKMSRDPASWMSSVTVFE